MRSGPPSRATSPSASPRVARAVVGNGAASSGADGSGNAVSASAALVASQRILALATKSLDMMRSLGRADAYVSFSSLVFFFFSLSSLMITLRRWVGRLRTVGPTWGTGDLIYQYNAYKHCG
jgi:hypothetical protein